MIVNKPTLIFYNIIFLFYLLVNKLSEDIITDYINNILDILNKLNIHKFNYNEFNRLMVIKLILFYLYVLIKYSNRDFISYELLVNYLITSKLKYE